MRKRFSMLVINEEPLLTCDVRGVDIPLHDGDFSTGDLAFS